MNVNTNKTYMVSAIITTHNRLTLLKRAIESVKLQTYRNIELIVVSDGSEDGTKEYCQSRNDLIFIHIPKEYSKGGNHARNRGIEQSTGNYIAFLDDDDYWMPTKIEHQVTAMKKHPECRFCYAAYHKEMEQDTYTANFNLTTPQIKEIEEHAVDISSRSLTWSLALTSSLFVERNFLTEVGLFDENLKMHQERELVIRMAQKSKAVQIDTPLWIYNIPNNDSNVSRKYENFKKSTAYLHKKHHTLYERLSKREKLIDRMMWLRVNKAMAINTGHYTNAILPYILIPFLRFRLKLMDITRTVIR